MKNARNSNIELLRIIAIIMIVFSHYCVHGIGVGITSKLDLGINRFILEIFVLGNIGTVLFVLISGYYLSNSKKVKLKKLIHLLFQILFYSVSIYFILYFLGLNSLSIKNIIKAFLPFTFKEYWFATCYIMLYLFHPYINRLLNTLSRKEHLLFILLMLLFFVILHTLTNQDYYGNELIQFIMIYCIGAYFNKYPQNKFGEKRNNLKSLLLSSCLIIISIISIDIIGTYLNIGFMNNPNKFLLSRTSPLVILFCCSLFDIFMRKKASENKFINGISILVFGVYLISDNKYIRPILWNNIFKCKEYISSPYLIIHLIVSVLITVIVCLLIEAIRKYLIEKPLFKRIESKIDLLQDKIESFFNKKLKNN